MGKKRTHLDDYKNRNKQKVFNAILEHGQISRTNIAKETSLSSSAVTLIVNELISQNIIKETGIKSYTGGRAQKLLSINEKLGSNISFYLERDFLIAGKVSAFTKIEDLITLDTKHMTLEEYLFTLSDIYKKWKKEKIFSVSIGVRSPKDFKNKRISISTSISTDYITINEALKFIFDIPVIVERAANLAALGEYRFASGKNNICYLNLNHEIQLGAYPFIPEEHVAHMKVDQHGDVCTCGKTGCLNTFVSSEVVLKKIKNKKKDSSLTWSTITHAYNSNDAEISKIVDEVAQYLSMGIVNISTIFNPDLFFLGGDVCQLGKKFEEKLTKSLLNFVYYGLEELQVKLSSLDKKNVLIGGARNFLLNLFQQGAD